MTQKSSLLCSLRLCGSLRQAARVYDNLFLGNPQSKIYVEYKGVFAAISKGAEDPEISLME